MSRMGQLQTTYTARGFRRYEIEVSHAQLHKFQIVRGDDQTIVGQKAQAVAAQWDDMWEKRRELEDKRRARATAAKDVEGKRSLAADRTEEARRAIEQLAQTLAHTLEVNDAVDWESLKDTAGFPEAVPVRRPDPPAPRTPELAPEPRPDDPRFRPTHGFFDFMFPSRRTAKAAAGQELFSAAHREWVAVLGEQKRQHECAVEARTAAVRVLDAEHRAAVGAWEERGSRYVADQLERNAAVDAKRQCYLDSDVGAISDYCGMVLSNSSYPDYFPQSYDLEYNAENHVLVVDYQLPSPSGVPSLLEVRYVPSKDEFAEKHMPSAQSTRMYDSLLYQIALRTIHELYEADTIGALQSIVFNGYVQSIDAATGQEVNACVLSVQAGREEFSAVNLASVDPHACFKKLKGVGSARLHSLAAVAPILAMSREDKRFVASHAVVDSIVEGDNLAAMDWEDFEHLIRELFEKEFSAVGGEVRVTRASRDGGVDAVIFDPDPLRGGKTVIQAKRYTNTVGVSAVRDLYGTVLNEGANKGILVTTSDYGPDAYEFAKGKPLVLLSGSNLLHLLDRHGHKARIDLQEAKRLAAEQDQDR